MVYQWSTGLYRSVDADSAGAEMERIEAKYGEVTCDLLVKESKAKKAVLHNLFEWDDKVAGEAYRRVQAQKIICALIKTPSEDEVAKSKTRAFVNIQTSEDITAKGRFVSIENAMSDEEMRKIVLKNALRELIMFKAKYKALTELAKVYEAIDDVQESFDFTDRGVA